MKKRKVLWSNSAIKLILSLIVVSFITFNYAQTPVSNAEELNAVRNNLNGNYIQTADIDLREIENWLPIGGSRSPFRGTYDGGGFKIINMTIERETASDIALFGGLMGETALIKNLGLENVNVTGGSKVAGLVAYFATSARIEQCYVAGEISGTSLVGGLVGTMTGTDATAPSILNCYASGVITSTADVGGLVGGNNNGIITNSYASAILSGNPDLMGGLVGFAHPGGTVNNGFWDTEASTAATSRGGSGRTTAQMLLQATYPTREWDFREVWTIHDEETYPFFIWQREPGAHNYPAMGSPSNLEFVAGDGFVNLTWDEPSAGVWVSYNIYRNNERFTNVGANVRQYRDEDVVNYTQYTYYVTAIWEDESESRSSNSVIAFPHESFAGGDGTEENPYQIATAQNLNDVRFHLNAHFIQIEDINLGVAPWNEDTGWQPIGYWVSTINNRPFSGSYDGNGLSINGLTIIAQTTNYVGLFGYLQGATLTNINLENVSILAANFIGAIAPYTGDGNNLSNIKVIAELEGTSYVGGLIGQFRGGNITNSITRGTFRGNNYVGGIAGQTISVAESSIVGCGSISTIVGGNQFIGGITGQSNIPIRDSFYSGDISGGAETAGIAGQNNSLITRCYATGTLNSHGVLGSGGIAGRNFNVISYCYVDMEMAAYRSIGGIAGNNETNVNALISNCYVRGSVHGNNPEMSFRMGGIAGVTNNDIINSYSTARVTGPDDRRGGLVGDYRAGTVTNSYWDIELSGLETSAAGFGRLSRQMVYPYDPQTYVNWDFDDVWQHDMNADVNDGYPLLYWQEIPDAIPAPVVSATIITDNGIEYCVLSWEAVTGANSYRIFAANDISDEDWGDPIAVVEETTYQEAVADGGTKRFYKVVASVE